MFLFLPLFVSAVFPGVGQHHNFHYNALGVLVALTFTGPKYFQQIVKFLYELQIDYFNKPGFGLSLSHLTPNICVRVKLLLASKRAQLIQHSVDMVIPEAQRGKHKDLLVQI